MNSNPQIKKMLENAGGRSCCDYLFQLKIVGDSGSGKSSLFRRFLDETSTEGARLHADRDVGIKTILIGGKAIKLKIWEEEKQRFRTGGPGPYAGIDGVIILYEVSDHRSFANVPQHLEEVRRYARENVNKLLVGNKCDLTALKVIDFDTAQQFADERNIPFLEASAKTSANVEEVFSLMATEILKRISRPMPPIEEKPRTIIHPSKKKGPQNKCQMQ